MQQTFKGAAYDAYSIDGTISSGKELQNILNKIGISDQRLLDRTKDIEE